jgi:hypothetical protein
MGRVRGVFVAGVLAVAVSVIGAGPAVAAKGGNNDTAKQCQKGGWKTLVSETGDPFVGQGDCVNDGAQGLGVVTLEGEAACEQIGGTFSTDASSQIVWQCIYPVPPNPAPPETPRGLQDPCTADSQNMGGLSTPVSYDADHAIVFCEGGF